MSSRPFKVILAIGCILLASTVLASIFTENTPIGVAPSVATVVVADIFSIGLVCLVGGVLGLILAAVIGAIESKIPKKRQ